ncbi:hypothetical protein KC19_5G054300 [Ceratodon purpureus]|uniref:Uncharacterized protein n=1 Tax=Ceratodon purpureus TaxID=3225 RepID=A0A8T0HY81_CERPU|nr:hypothetical protein KC19_5G054300 [Ceratodon purpureus]
MVRVGPHFIYPDTRFNYFNVNLVHNFGTMTVYGTLHLRDHKRKANAGHAVCQWQREAWLHRWAPKAEQTCSICNSSPPSSPSNNPRTSTTTTTTTTVCVCLCLWPGNPHPTPKLIYLITTHSIPSFPLSHTVNSCAGYSALCFTRGLDWIGVEWSEVVQEEWRGVSSRCVTSFMIGSARWIQMRFLR